MLADFTYALRLLRRSPGFAAAAILTLGLGMGANTAIFSVVDAALFKPLPYRAADRLVEILQVQRKGRAEETAYRGMSRAEMEQWRAQRAVFDGIEPYKSAREMVLAGTGGARPVRVASLSPRMVEFLGMPPALGRGFAPEEATAGQDRVVILSAGLWRRSFAEDRTIVGHEIVLDGSSYTVIGVMPPDFRFPNDPPPDAWKPLTANVDPSAPGSSIVGVVARLQPALTIDRAAPILQEASAALERSSPRPEGWAARLTPFDSRWDGRGSRNILLILLGAVGFVVLIGCANLANLQLARALDRQREMVVRTALGATRGRNVRLLLAENLLVSSLGGIAALAVARWSISLIPAIVPPQVVYFGAHAVQLDWRVFGFAAVMTLGVGLLTGTLPAVQGTKTLSRGMNERRMAGVSPARRRTQNLFLVAQVALATVLLAGAGLMTVSLIRLLRIDLGYEPDRLVAVTVSLPAKAYPLPAQQAAFLNRLRATLDRTPGLEQVTFGSLPGNDGGGRFIVEGLEAERPAGGIGATAILYADPAYFRVLGIPLLRGRAFDETDRVGTAPVAIIDRDAANTFWPGQDAIGKRFRYSPLVDWITVVGIAGDIRTGTAASGRRSFEVYLPSAQGGAPMGTVIARAARSPSDAIAAITAHVQELDPNAPIAFAGLVQDGYARQLAPPRFLAALYWLFAGLGLVTAAVGLYGTLAYAVTRRTAELGVRMALGASGSDLRRMVTLEGLRPVAAGLVCGIVAAQRLARLLAGQLYGVTPHDPATYAGVAGVLLAVAAVAAYVPAVRASRVDPMVALRAE